MNTYVAPAPSVKVIVDKTVEGGWVTVETCGIPSTV
jgi:hypothetical protein